MSAKASRKRNYEVSKGGIKIVDNETVHKVPRGRASVHPGWRKGRRDFYERHFGPSLAVMVDTSRIEPAIDIHVHGPSRGRQYCTLVTSGMSDWQMKPLSRCPRQIRRFELIAYLPDFVVPGPFDRRPWPVRLLHELGKRPFHFGAPLGHYHTVTVADRNDPLAEGSEMTTALLLPPFVEDMAVLYEGMTLSGGHPVQFMWVELLSSAECQHRLDHGTDALLQVLNLHRRDFFLDVKRRSFL